MSLWILGHESHCGLDYPLWLRHHDQELHPCERDKQRIGPGMTAALVKVYVIIQMYF